MTGPAGDLARGWWRFIAIEPTHRIEFDNGVADDTGSPDPNMPAMVVRVALSEKASGGTQMSVESVFPSAEAMERFMAMGMREGMSSAIASIDALL
jgi:uncharacterized protein YndB with AHSA1/START domain